MKHKNMEVAKIEEQFPILSAGNFFDENVVSDPNDIVIPRILLMQGVSTLVGQQKAQQGDIIDSMSTEVLGNSKTQLEFIPIKQLDKTWVIEKKVGRKFEFERVDPWDPSFDKQWDFTEGGVEYRRNARLSFYVLLARDATTNHLPYLISFQRTGYSAGKNLASFFSEALFAFKKGDQKSIPMAQVFTLGCHVEHGDLGPYYVLDLNRGRGAKTDELDKAKYWFSQLRTKNYKVHAEASASEEHMEKDEF